MKIESISFENYKAFKGLQTVKVKPITLLIGKNSSGKSAIAKLFTLLGNSLSKTINEPLLLVNDGVELGGRYSDIVYNQNPSASPLIFKIRFSTGEILTVSILQEKLKYDLTIYEWSIEGNGRSFSVKYSPETGYVDKEGRKYSCTFSGFLPIEILNEEGQSIMPQVSIEPRVHVDYIGPFRILPKRHYYLSGQIQYEKVGIQGENAYSILGVSKLMKSDLHEKVGDWYEKHFDKWKLNVKEENSYVQLVLTKDEIDVNIVDVGQGMNQALPLVVRAYTKNPNSIVVMEQPELHLHPAAHGDLIELFALSAKEGEQSIVVETHSENILSRLRKLVVEEQFGLTKEDVVIYWINEAEGGGQDLTEITIASDGVLTDWPDGVFAENLSEIIEIRKAVMRKKEAVGDNKV